MPSTTANKKEISDFLWEWAESHGDWARYLIDKVVCNECNLSDTERQLTFDYFLQSIKLKAALPPLKINKPRYSPTSKDIKLENVTGISGINRLAKNQNLNFSKNITVIYGENGSGKTGYGRLLKALGFSYESNCIIHYNVYGKREPKSAIINYVCDGVTKSFKWDGSNTNDELKNISIFNTDCVKISLSDRHLIVAPIGFHLFHLVTTELAELTKLLQKQIEKHSVVIPWIENLTLGTQQQIFIQTLNHNSSLDRLKDLSNFSIEDEERLKNSKEELEKLNKALIEIEVKNLTLQIAEIAETISQIEETQKNLNDSTFRVLVDCNRKIRLLENQSQFGLKEIAELNGIEFYESKEFLAFITSAEQYIKLLNADYPETNSCIYCRQSLDENARELIRGYRTILNDKRQEELKKLQKTKSDLIKQISLINTKLILHQPTWGVDENKKSIQPQEVLSYNEKLSSLKKEFLEDHLTENSKFEFNYDDCIKFLSGKQEALNKLLSSKRSVLTNLSSNEERLGKIINELKDRKLLSAKADEIKEAIIKHKIISILRANSNSFNTGSLSRKTSEAREELVKQNFNDLFRNELQLFRKSNLNIELSFGTERGSSKVSQKISSFPLGDILSEGEQKAIALAEFLTEVQLDITKAPVVFDDPVNSLDHRIIDEVVKRFITLSEKRQIIVFTHSILMLNSFLQQRELSTNSAIDFVFHKVENNFSETGIIGEVEEINSYNYYIGKLNPILATKNSEEKESKLAAEGYAHLRSAIEVCVEESILQKTIRRYRKGVAFPSLLRINGNKLDQYKSQLNDIYEKCCVSIAGHSSPSELHSEPRLDELRIDYESFKQIKAAFK